MYLTTEKRKRFLRNTVLPKQILDRPKAKSLSLRIGSIIYQSSLKQITKTLIPKDRL
ncbi:MAG: hypothetical protein CM15mP59_2650 [Flavobacteriaceae bacterium]|nr:MAG: hypothetical protein CM15mP59_2650 [Flavobacteriaceae bacterium]